MYQQAQQFFRQNDIDVENFDYFDYAQFFETLNQENLNSHPRKRKIVQKFMLKCQQKLNQKQKNKGSWKRFLERVQANKKYRQQKYQALRFIRDHYDEKNKQILFYPKLTKNYATQQGRFWKDTDDIISQEGQIYKPNESTFQQ